MVGEKQAGSVGAVHMQFAVALCAGVVAAVLAPVFGQGAHVAIWVIVAIVVSFAFAAICGGGRPAPSAEAATKAADKEKEKCANSIAGSEWAIPFGRYVHSGERTVDTEESMVGREGERAYLIDRLSTCGVRGSFLITGRRGMGKSSFVNYCLGEYRAAIFKRFLRRNAGKSFGDAVFILLASLVVVLAVLLVSDLMQVMMEVRNDEAHLLWLIIVPIATLCLYPLVYAHQIMDALLHRPWSRIRQLTDKRPFFPRNMPKASLAFVLAVSAVLSHWGGFALNGSGLIRFFTIVCAYYAAVQWLSRSNIERWAIWFGGSILVAWAFSTLFLLDFDSGHRLSDYIRQVALACVFVSVGTFGRSRWLECDDSGSEITAGKLGVVGAYRWLSGALLSIGILLFLVLILNGGVIGPVWWWMLAGAVMVVPVLLGWNSRNVGISHFLPRPGGALMLKAVFSIVVGLQLANPVLSPFYANAKEFISSSFKALHASGSDVPGVNLIYASDISDNNKISSDEYVCAQVFFGYGNHADNYVVKGDGTDGIYWIFSIMVLVTIFNFLEYEWIIRAGVRERDDSSLDLRKLAQWRDRSRPMETGTRRRYYRDLERLTIPWMVYQAWLPTIVVTVNLGFDKLDHRSVIQAMLVGLRQEYKKVFLGWNSPFANVIRFLSLLMILFLVACLSELWFRIPDISVGQAGMNRLDEGTAGNSFCRILFRRQHMAEQQEHDASRKLNSKIGVVPVLLCGLWYETEQRSPPQSTPSLDGSRLLRTAPNANGEVRSDKSELVQLIDVLAGRDDPKPPFWLEQYVLPTLYAELLPIPGYERFGTGMRLTDYILNPSPPFPADYKECSDGKPCVPRSLSVRVYHVILFVALLSLWRWLFATVPVLPYRRNLAHIDDLLDALTARTTTKAFRERWKLATWVRSLFVDDQSREIERQPLDSRAIELALMNILADMQKDSLSVPGRAPQRISIPVPEITFVFDELDKIGPQIDPATPEPAADVADMLSLERQRSLAMHKLLSDMKRLIASAPARFIFVGGRLLHDEWLADLTTRQPLLTSIFNAQIYLPSLLVDKGRNLGGMGDRFSLVTRTDQYLRTQKQAADAEMQRTFRRGLQPGMANRWDELVGEGYVQVCRSGETPPPKPLLELIDCHGNTLEAFREAFIKDFVAFLSYRSVGTPKKLRDLLSNFVRPAGRVLHQSDGGPLVRSCHDVLFFKDRDIFRVQMIATIFGYLTDRFEEQLLNRDDKITAAVFYIADFMLRFHDRAFSWDDLERIDELAHIHRAPDLRDLLVSVVEQCSGRFLQRVLNGMYTYRLRSDLAKEITYISRVSGEEMAALNFTLDETRSLKALYSNQTQRSNRPDFEVVAGLGELFEYDQDFESARDHYRHALRLIDEEFEYLVGRVVAESGVPHTHSLPALSSVLRGEWLGLNISTLFMPWGIQRLRLMLQLGMTYERARNMEMAETEYRTARLLSLALLNAYLGEVLEGDGPADETGMRSRILKAPRNPNAVKHLSLLFQSLFASAWIAEKLEEAIDTSAQIIETEILKIRRLLPFARDEQQAFSASRTAHANFALIMAELHNKAGDLFFFKGRQKVEADKLHEHASTRVDARYQGYLLRAHYHYAVGLHEVRRYIMHRRRNSGRRFGLWDDEGETFTARQWPKFVSLAASNAMSDMSETLLSRLSLFGLRGGMSFDDMRIVAAPSDGASMEEACFDWLAGEASSRPVVIRWGDDAWFSLGLLDNWFGKPVTLSQDLVQSDNPFFVEFNEDMAHTHAERMLGGINIAMQGAAYYRHAGALEETVQEYLQVAGTINAYLWWLQMVEKAVQWQNADTLALGIEPEPRITNTRIHRYLVWAAIRCYEQAERALRKSRQSQGDANPRVPRAYFTQLCSLALVRSVDDFSDPADRQILELLRRNLGGDLSADLTNQQRRHQIRTLLHNNLRANRYPMMNRLHGLKVLVDSVVVLEDVEHVGCARAWADELIEANALFDAPMHFTPLHVGASLAMLSLWDRPWESGCASQRERYRMLANRLLGDSIGSYTMGRSYYENISGLHYLYDDFNDRKIHHSQALQMAGSELASLLRHLVSRGESQAWSGFS